MNLTTIHATAFKGRNFNHELGRLTIIAGPNNTGKTAVADAVRLVLLGNLPGHPATNAGIFALSSKSTMTVSGRFDDPTRASGYDACQVSRTWTQKGKTIKATDIGVDALPSTPLVMMDAGAYFGASDRARTQMVFDLLRLAERSDLPTKDSITAAVRAMATTPAAEEIVERILYADSSDLQEWINGAAENATEEAKAAAMVKKRMIETQQGIASLAIKDEPVDEAKVATEMTDTQRMIETTTGERGRLSAIVEANDKTEARRAELDDAITQLMLTAGLAPLSEDVNAEHYARTEKQLQEISAANARALQEESDAGARASRVAGLRERLEKLTAGPAVEDLKARVAEIEAMIANALVIDTQKSADECLNAQIAKTTAIAQQSSIERAVRKTNIEEQQLHTMTACPTCGSTGHEWKEALREKLAKEFEDLALQERKVASEYAAATERLDRANAAREAARAEVKRSQDLHLQLGEARLAVSKAEADRATRANLIEQITELEKPRSAMPALDMESERMLKGQLLAIRENRERISAHQKLADLRAELGRMAPQDIDADQCYAQASADMESLRERMTFLQTQQQKAQNQKADAKRLAEAEEQVQAATAAVELVKKVQTYLTEARETLINSAFGPLLAVANTFVARILPTPLELRECELGRQEGANWIPVRCFGGAHTAATYAGLQAALGAQAPARIVIVDELGRLDHETKVKFLRNVEEAIDRGDLGQFIGIDVDPGIYRKWNGLTLIEMKKGNL